MDSHGDADAAQVELMLKMHEGGGGNLTTEQTACEFLKQQQLICTGTEQPQ